MRIMDEGWLVLGLAPEPLLEATESEVKAFVETNYPRADLSVQSPDGKEYIYEGGEWVEI